MKTVLGTLNTFVAKAKLRKGLLFGLAIFFFFQIYFVRELLAAELLFGLVFGVMLVLGCTAYVVGAIGERGLDVAEAGIRIIARSARWSSSVLDDISRKPFRHPRSESAQ